MTKLEKEILENLIVYNPKNKKIRLGQSIDGGYVIIDGYDYDIYLSCGIGNDVGFDIDFANYRPNINGFAFDGTCDKPINLPSNIEFIKKNIGIYENESITNMSDYTGRDNIFLKMDIEGHEWHWIKSLGDLSKFKQIVLECHGFFDEDCPTGSWSEEEAGNFSHEDILKSLQILNKTHYLVHIHGNNAAVVKHYNGEFGNAKGIDEFFTVAELTYIRKDCDIEGLNTNSLPIINLDFPNYNFIPDVHIDKWPFVNKNNN
jgi:hypothetical protein